MNQENPLYGVIVSLVTPFENETLHTDWLVRNIEKLNATGIRGYLVLGGNGEYMCLSEYEQLDIVDVTVAHKQDKVVIAGIACESSQGAIEFSRKMVDRGVDLLRVMPPHYFAKLMNDEVLIRFYLEVADKVSVPVLMYNVPKLTGGVKLSAETVRLLARHHNIIGVKDSSPDGIYGFLASTRDNPAFNVLAGSASIFFPAMVAGATGGDMSLANFLPGACCDLYDAFKAGDLTKARQLHHSLFTLNAGVSGRFGVPGVKAAMDIMGYRGGEPRRPLQALSNQDRELIRSLIASEDMLP